MPHASRVERWMFRSGQPRPELVNGLIERKGLAYGEACERVRFLPLNWFFTV